MKDSLSPFLQTMLVQLSPYKTVKTSIQLPTNSRRRKRNENEGSVSELSVEASFITTSSRRGQQKWKQHSEEFIDTQPVLLLSSDHQISIIGKKKDNDYDEFSNLRYTSRPGNVSSFAPTSNTRTTKDHRPRIPPILDAKNDQVYALQNGNARLTCWNALHANGPDEISAVKVDLAQPAVSMSLLSLHKGVVYGSCLDGSIFVARLGSDAEGKGTFLVEYLPNKRCSNFRHVGTVAEMPRSHAKGTGRKRKMSDAEGGTIVHIYQVFHDDKGIQLFRHEVQFERMSSGDKIIIDSYLNERDVRIQLVTENEDILRTATLNTCNIETSKAAITFEVRTQQGSKKLFSSLLSLTAGIFTHYRVDLPDETLHHGMISESILVVGTKQSLHLIDLETGSTLFTLSLPKDICESPNSWLLRTDSKLGTLALLHENDGVLSCDTSSLTFEDHHQITQSNTRVSLASKLASSVHNAKAHAGTGTALLVNNLLNLNALKQAKREQTIMVTIQQALDSLEEARIKSITPSSTSIEDFIFMNTYEEAVAMLLTALKHKSKLESPGGHNPQDDAHCNGHRKVNGVSSKAAKNGLSNHQSPLSSQPRAFTPPILPQSFLDGATQIVLKVLRAEPSEDRMLSRRIMLARLDARVILSRLLHTGKLSARLHFDGTESIESSLNSEHILTATLRSVKLSQKRGRRVFTPVDMMFTMLQKCPDVSERQMVVMLNYMMRRALPEDIAEMFFDERKNGLHNQHVSLAQKFFALRTSLLKAGGPTDKVQSPELDKLRHRLILAGTSYLLYRILSYSQCNEPMLRVALQDTIETQEALILARALSNMLASSRRKDIVAKTPPSVGAMKTICQWAAAISDSFHDDLAAATMRVNGQSFLSGLLSAVKVTTKHSQEIMSLREDVQRVDSEIHSTLNAKHNPLSTRVLANQEELPGYSVETLRF